MLGSKAPLSITKGRKWNCPDPTARILQAMLFSPLTARRTHGPPAEALATRAPPVLNLIRIFRICAALAFWDRTLNDVLPPLLGAAKARLGASSSRMRQWVESEPCGL